MMAVALRVGVVAKVFPYRAQVLLRWIAAFADDNRDVQSPCGHQDQDVGSIAKREHNIRRVFADRGADGGDSISSIEKLGGQTSALEHQIESLTNDSVIDRVTFALLRHRV